MKKSPPAESPDAYVEALAGWRRALVEKLRGCALAAGKLEERIKWGNLVYLSNGPVLLIRAEDERVLFGFWRGKRLKDICSRLKPGGKYEMATMALEAGDTIDAAQAKRLVKAAVALNRKLGDPTDIGGTAAQRGGPPPAKSTGKRKVPRRRAAREKTAAGFDVAALRKVVLQLPDVKDATTDRGIAFKAGGRLLVCEALHASAEPGSLVVCISREERPRLIAAHPRALYLTDHYVKHPAVLARLAELDAAALRDILGAAWLYVTEKAAGRKPGRSRRKG